MPVLMKIRTDSDYSHFDSMLSSDYEPGDRFQWGTIGRYADFRSAGDVNFVRDNGLYVGEQVLVRERHTASRVHFVALLEVAAIREGVDTWTPTYTMVERFDGSATLDQLRKSQPKIADLPHFQRNAKGYMLRSFTPMRTKELSLVLAAVRSSMAV